MTNIISPQSKEGCSHCRLTNRILGDYLAFYLCHATVGEERFSPNSDCLAAAALRQMGVPVDNFTGLTVNFNRLKGRG